MILLAATADTDDRHRILVVDDTPDFADTLARLLDGFARARCVRRDPDGGVGPPGITAGRRCIIGSCEPRTCRSS